MSKTHPLIATILKRTSIRKFKVKKIPETDVNRIVDCGQRAPTGGNSQLYTLIEVKDKTLRKKITEICHNQEFIYEASHFFVICTDIRRLEKVIQYVEEDPKCSLDGTLSRFMFGIMDASFVAQNMVIAAEALGYSSIYIGSVTTKIKEVCELLKLPKGVLPVVGLALGVPAEQPPLRPRLPKEIIWQIDRYQDPSSEKLAQAIEHMDEILRLEGYYEKYGGDPKDEYFWSTHMCKKLMVETLENAEQIQKQGVQHQSFLENF
ncbi:MAG: nitroreductase family protein [Candidatus Heimdallarchaeota archaeon]